MMSTDSPEPRRGLTPYEPPEGGSRFLSDIIIELGLAEEGDVSQAVEEARSSLVTVGQILVRQGTLSEDDLARAIAARYGLGHIDLSAFEIDPTAANLLPPATAQRYKAVPVAFEPDGSLLVAMADPADSLATTDIAHMTHLEVRPAVAAEQLIVDLAGDLPLTVSSPMPSAPGDAPPAPAHGVQAEPAEPTLGVQADFAGAAPAAAPPARGEVNHAELERLEAALGQANAALESERSEHEQLVAELRQQLAEVEQQAAELGQQAAELGQQATGEEERTALEAQLAAAGGELDDARSELEALRRELDGAHSEREGMGVELEDARSELEARGRELDSVRSELAAAGADRDAVRGELEEARSNLTTERAEHEATRSELAALSAELSEARTEAEANREAAGRVVEAERRLAEMEDLDARLTSAHAMVDKLRAEFELEREGYAASERELRASLAHEAEQHEALAHMRDELQKRLELLQSQNAALLDVHATAKRWSDAIVREAGDFAAALEQVAPDHTIRSSSGPIDGDGKEDAKERDEAAGSPTPEDPSTDGHANGTSSTGAAPLRASA